MIQITDFINRAKGKAQKEFYERFHDKIESIRDRLHEYKEAIKGYSKTLYENGALPNMARVASEDAFFNKYFESLQFENNAKFIFKYKSFEDTNVFSPMQAAHMININRLRNIIDMIFKIPTKGRLKKNSNKGKLLRLLKLLYF